MFLDEVGDIPLGIQVKILRAIDNSEIIRVGGTQSRKLDVRIISATNKNMADEVTKGRFREDLFYRLNVVPFVIRPLRERPQMIVPLSMDFLKANNVKYNFNKKITQEALEELRNHYWPGNIRELKNVIERLAIMGDDQIITGSNVREVLSAHNAGIEILADHKEERFLPEQPLGQRAILNEYDSYEQTMILDALKKTGGNKSKAAQILGMSRTKLYSKLKK